MSTGFGVFEVAVPAAVWTEMSHEIGQSVLFGTASAPISNS